MSSCHQVQVAVSPELDNNYPIDIFECTLITYRLIASMMQVNLSKLNIYLTS